MNVANAVAGDRRAETAPPARHQTGLPATEILHSANSGVVVERVAQVRAGRYRQAHAFALDTARRINTKQVGTASMFVYEETFGTRDRLHFLLHLTALDGYYPMLRMADEAGPDEGAPTWNELFVPGSVQETVLLPQFWGMYGAKVAGIVMHRTAQMVYDFRSEARKFGREVAESINKNLPGECTVFVYEEAFGGADRLHWLMHLKDLNTYMRLLELHVRDEEVRDIYFRDRIGAEKGGGTWARMFVDGSMVDTALTALR